MFWYEMWNAYGVARLTHEHFQIAAQPNIRHALIDESDLCVETAEIHSIRKVSIPVDEGISAADVPHYAGERSIHHFPSPTVESEPVIYAERLPTPSNGSNNGHLNEWSGDTLVASEAKEFLGQCNSQTTSRWRNRDGDGGIITTVQRRLFPTLRSGMSPAVACGDTGSISQHLWETPDSSSEPYACPSRHYDIGEENPPLNESFSSSGTVKVYPPAHTPQPPRLILDKAYETTTTRATPDYGTPTATSRASDPSKGTQMDIESPLGAARRIKVARKPIFTKAWQSPSQEDFSPNSKYRLGVPKLAQSSPTKNRNATTSDPKPGSLKKGSQPRRLKSRSLDQLNPTRDYLGIGAPARFPSFKQTTYTVGCANGRGTDPTIDNSVKLPSKSRNGSPYATASPKADTPIWSDGSAKSSPSPNNGEVLLPPRSHNSTPYFKGPKTASSNGIHNALEGGPYPASQNLDSPIFDGFDSDADGYNPSLDTKYNEDCPHTSPRIDSQLSSPDISDRPWIRRDIASSRFFPPDSDPHGDPKKDPFWIRFEGKLYICFPSNSELATYQIETHAAVHLSEPDTGGWYGFSIPGLPRLHKSQPSGRLSFFQGSGRGILIDKSLFDYCDDSGPYLISGGSHFGTSHLLRLRFQSPIECQTQHPHDGLVAEDNSTLADKCLEWPGSEPLLVENELEHLKVQPYSHEPLSPASAHEAVKSDDVEVGTQSEDEMSKWANERIKLCPVQFAGLVTRDDPLEMEDSTKLAWNLNMRVGRIVTGELECQMSLQVPFGTMPLLVADAREWVPNFSIINGMLATRGEWRETKEGDLALQSVPSIQPGKVMKVDMYWKEFAVVDELNDHEAPRTKEYRLPNIVDKVILNGNLTCTIDNAVIVLNDTEGEEITWRVDSTIGCNSTWLPKLYPGYRLHLKVEEDTPSISDDLESLPDMDTCLELAVPAPRDENTDKRVAGLTAPVTIAEADCSQPQAVQASSHGNTASTADDLAASIVLNREPSSRSHTTTVVPTTPFTFRQFFKHCMLMILLSNIFEQVLMAFIPAGQFYNHKALETEGAREGYRDFLDDITFGLNLFPSGTSEDANRGSEEPKSLPEETKENPAPEEAIPSIEEVSQVVAEKLQGGRSWRDSIDYALGWREIRD